MSTKQVTGAPANLKRLETHEADAEQQVNEIKGRLNAVRELLTPNGDDEAQRALKLQVSALQSELVAAYDLWFKLSRQVRDFDKSVKEERRTGAVIPQADVEQMLEQVFRFDRIAQETQILTISQDAIRCKDEQEYYERFAESHRTCRLNAILQGVEHEKFPSWVRESFERSL